MESRLGRLTAAECRRLLRSAPLGHLVIPTSHFPTVEPVSFGMTDGAVVVVARAGSAADALGAGARVALEAGIVDPQRRRGWSAVVHGAVEDLVAGTVHLERLVAPWPAGPGDRLLLVRPDRIAGQWVADTSPFGQEIPARGPAGHQPPGHRRGGHQPAVRQIVGPALWATPARCRDGHADTAAVVPWPVPAGRPAAPAGPSAPVTRRELPDTEALALLARGGQRVGRLALTVNGEPVVYPVNFAVDGDAVVFRTRTGSKLAGITRSMASFEVDDLDQLDHTGQGWSVVLEGLAQEVLDADPPALRERLGALPLDPWPGGDRRRMVRITPFRVSGAAWTVTARQPAIPASLVSAGGG